MKKLLGVVVVVLLLGGGGYGYWWSSHRPPVEGETAAPGDGPTIEPAETADKPEVEAAPLALTEVGCSLRPAAGWQRTEAPADLPLLPAGTPAVLLTKPSQAGPVLLVARLTKELLGQTDPAQYPAKFDAAVRKRLAALDPPAVLQAEPAPELSWLQDPTWAVAQGQFGELGLPSGTGRFLCGRDEAGLVYVIAGFSGDDATGKEVLDMIRSLAADAPAAATAVPAESPTQ